MTMSHGRPDNIPKPLIAGLVPGGCLMRVLTEDDEVIGTYKIRTEPEHHAAFDHAAEVARSYLMSNPEATEVRLAAFDGDKGNCIALIATNRERLFR